MSDWIKLTNHTLRDELIEYESEMQLPEHPIPLTLSMRNLLFILKPRLTRLTLKSRSTNFTLPKRK
jgi:hypothetical protein